MIFQVGGGGGGPDPLLNLDPRMDCTGSPESTLVKMPHFWKSLSLYISLPVLLEHPFNSVSKGSPGKDLFIFDSISTGTKIG